MPGAQLLEIGRRSEVDVVEYRHYVSAGKGQLAAQHLVQHDAKGKNIGATIYFIPARLLRRHVRSRASHDPRQGKADQLGALRVFFTALFSGVTELGEAEVQHLDNAVARHHDVARLQVSVHHSGCVGLHQGIGDLDAIAQGLLLAQLSGLQQSSEGGPAHILHDDEICVALGVDLMDGDDIGMVERGCRHGLALKATPSARSPRPVGGQKFDRHVPAQTGVTGKIDLSHGAGADALAHLIVQQFSCRPRVFLGRFYTLPKSAGEPH